MNPQRPSLHALWLVRRNLTQHPGGDTTQILRTQAALEERGVRVTLADALPRALASYDVVHLFHLDRLWEHLPICRTLRDAGVPAVLSTIWWPPDAFDRNGRRGVQGLLSRALGSPRYQSLRLVQRWGLARLRGESAASFHRLLLHFRAAGRELLETVRVILPNSVAERDAVRDWFGCERPAVVVPNAVDRATFDLDESPAPGTSITPDPSAAGRAPRLAGEIGRGEANGAQRAGVLCVGRIEPRKNQLALVRALRDLGVPLTLVGQTGRFSTRYGKAVQAAAGAGVTFLPAQESGALRGLYRRHAVHACVSWYETPGLASLEAGLCGCRLVVTPGGCTREYFEDFAEYCDPADSASIRAAVTRALQAPNAAGLAARIRQNYNWELAAEQTIKGYHLSISQDRNFV